MPDRCLLDRAQCTVLKPDMFSGKVAYSLDPERPWGLGVGGCGAGLEGLDGAARRAAHTGGAGQGGTRKVLGVASRWGQTRA